MKILKVYLLFELKCQKKIPCYYMATFNFIFGPGKHGENQWSTLDMQHLHSGMHH